MVHPDEGAAYLSVTPHVNSGPTKGRLYPGSAIRCWHDTDRLGPLWWCMVFLYCINMATELRCKNIPFWQNFRHQLHGKLSIFHAQPGTKVSSKWFVGYVSLLFSSQAHRKLSFQQLAVQPVTKISPKWHFHVSVDFIRKFSRSKLRWQQSLLYIVSDVNISTDVHFSAWWEQNFQVAS